MNWTPSDRNSSSASKRCLVERAKRSKRQTKIESNFRLRASAMSSLSSGRESFAPDWPMSMYSRMIVRPRAEQYARRSRSCISQRWSLVDTRQYRATLMVGSTDRETEKVKGNINDAIPSGEHYQCSCYPLHSHLRTEGEPLSLESITEQVREEIAKLNQVL